MMLEAGLDIKVASVGLGHANTQITRDLYMKVRQAVLDEAAERVLMLVQGEEPAGVQEA
ncbi:hypothetical protein [Spongiactinospora gelatinilytica]|uniref:hypothetical protein n=1 Tax=Spongiactinospora gelatinilytica TaxID=2666298 RepID=UPI0034D1728D